MTPERWKRIEELYHEACARPRADRGAFLGSACADDTAMRRDVESLLGELESDDGFLAESPLADQSLAAFALPSMAGTTLGGYHLQELIGVGGMGEVYRARDGKLERDVAIKILPAAFTGDPQRLARFEREARMLAALNHPNICAIHGFEESGGVQFLILELVEGATLAKQLAQVIAGQARPGGLPLGQALDIARQIAEALDVAHDKGIVHRDLKPANVTITADGVAKVLDFGLAKAIRGDGSSSDLTRSPAGAPGEPRQGAIIGTAAYMSPEQARGLPVDKRTDIWAFGCVLYEMLTGRLAFAGATVSDSIAKILEREPDWTALPLETPVAIRRLLMRCLQKDPRDRLRDIADARIDFKDALTESTGIRSAAWATQHTSHRGRRGLPWLAAGIASAGLLAAAFAWFAPRGASLLPALRLEVGLGADVLLVKTGGAAAILSPDGQTLAFAARTAAGVQRLYVRPLDQLQATPLQGTDGAFDPFFSPDGQWIAFFADGKLKKVAVTGGPIVSLSDAPESGGGTWAEDDTIVFSPSFIGPLVRVSSAGGTPEALTTPAEGELTQRWPQLLPGGKAVLYTASDNAVSVASANLVIQSLPNGPRTIVQQGASYGRYVSGAGPPGRTGHLIYMQGATLFAAPFDPVRLALTGPASAVIDGVTADNSGGGSGVGGAQLALADTGTLVYRPGAVVQAANGPVVWAERTGSIGSLLDGLADWSHQRFSPDGRRLALDRLDHGNIDVWVYDIPRGDMARLTTHPADDAEPAWTPDGQRLSFVSTRENSTTNLYWQRADGMGDAQRLTRSENQQFGGSSWHPGGRILAFTEVDPQTGSDLMVLRMDGDEASGWKPATPTVFLRTPANERQPMFSPDGRWLAYVSNESGVYEVYVQPYPGPGGRSKISNGSSHFYTKLSWSPTSAELLFGAADRHIIAVPYSVEENTFHAGRPRLWSERLFLELPRGGTFDLHPDGARVAIGAAPEAPPLATPDHVVFVFNFFDELRRIARIVP